MYIYIYSYIHIYIHIYTCTYIHAHTYVDIYVYIYNLHRWPCLDDTGIIFPIFFSLFAGLVESSQQHHQRAAFCFVVLKARTWKIGPILHILNIRSTQLIASCGAFNIISKMDIKVQAHSGPPCADYEKYFCAGLCNAAPCLPCFHQVGCLLISTTPPLNAVVS